MAGEIFAAFRTILLFISVSWLSVMYLLVYRIPKLERVSLNEGRINKALRYRDGIQIFGDEFTAVNGDSGNPGRRLQFAYYNKAFELEKQDLNNLTSKPPQDKHGLVFPTSFDCRDLNRVKFLGLLGSGYTKTVRRGYLNGRQFAVKYTAEQNRDIVKCTKERDESRHFECYNLAKFKLLKEAMLLQQLRHPNIVKIYGLCPWRSNDVEGSESIMTVITEIGKPLNMVKLIQIPWDERLKMAMDLIGLMQFFETSPLGSLQMRDFRIDQFIIVNDKTKLTDLDDVDGKLKQCSSSTDCFVGGRTGNTTLPCENEFCSRYAAISNLYNLDKTFLDYSFNYDNPDWLANDLKEISRKVKSFSLGFKEILGEIQDVVEKIKNGTYSKKIIENGMKRTNIPNYEMFLDASILTVSSDYYCRQSRTYSSCEITVNSIEEAKIICSLDENCKAFVITPKTNWLGQKIVILKNSGRMLTPVTNFTAFVRNV